MVDWLGMATSVLLLSIVLNLGLFYFGFVDTGFFSSTGDGTSPFDFLTKQDSSLTDSNFISGHEPFTNKYQKNLTENKATISIPIVGVVELPNLTSLSDNIFSLLKGISEYPWWISHGMEAAMFPRSIIFIVGGFFAYLQIGAAIFFSLTIIKAFTGGG